MTGFWLFTIFIGLLLLISLGAGYAIASRIVGREAAQRNLRRIIPVFLILFVIGLAIAFVLPLLGKYGTLLGKYGILGFNILYAVFAVTYPLSWLWRRRQAGSLVLDLGQPLPTIKFMFWIGVFEALVAAFLTFFWLLRIISMGVQGSHFSVSGLTVLILSWSMAILFCSMGLSRLQLRENGICYLFQRMSWQRITSYAWERAKPNILTIRFKPRFAFMSGLWSLPIPIAKKDEVERILAEYLPGKSGT